MSELPFAKYEASGNDFVVVGDERLSAAQARQLCHRRKGVGADGVISISPGLNAPFSFRLLNADGSEAQVSGNGLRCLGAFMYDRGLLEEAELDVETPAGLRHLNLEVVGGKARAATVDMGTPVFTLPQIPMLGSTDMFLGQPFEVEDGQVLTASALSMGNPHLVLFVDSDPAEVDLARLGPALENHPSFPDRTNVEFAWPHAESIDVRVWERGVGETLSCGTGACAVAVAAGEEGLVPARVVVNFRGGPLVVERTRDGRVLLGGPVSHVFDGIVELGTG